jgi:hypothetical protein
MFRQCLNQKRYSISLDKIKSRFALVGKLEYSYTRTATGMDGTLPHCSFENLKPVEIVLTSFEHL